MWLHVMKGAFMCTIGKKNDIAHAYNYEEYVVFDIARAEKEFINYSIIESFKNGFLFSGKYDSTTKIFKSAKVVIFANVAPDEDKWSNDRYDVIDLDNY